jgi:hydroxymethylglutaryl-CoA reductase
MDLKRQHPADRPEATTQPVAASSHPSNVPSAECPESLDTTNRNPKSSRLPGFYELPITTRLEACQEFSGMTAAEGAVLAQFGSVSKELVDVFIENAVGTFALPLGVATNFHINGRDYLVPMAVEESSVLAAASHGAKLARAGGGFTATSTPPIMTGQIQLLVAPDVPFDALLRARKSDLIAFANRGQERLIARGGGALDLTWRYVPEIQSLVIHLHIDTRDAMGANIVNTMCERISGLMPELFPCEIGLRILTNLTDRRMAKTTCRVPWQSFQSKEFNGKQVVERIVMAYQFADHDVYRAATNNKGIMNGIDPVVIATGNDWRAVEAGAHAYAAMSGRYRPLAKWTCDANHDLIGELELPMALGVVGGVTKLHPGAKASLKLLGSPTASELGEIATCVGLAQNLSALRALASEGIQRGHMGLHKSNLDLLQNQAPDPRSGASRT